MKKLDVLIVEDNEVIANQIAQFLEGHGWQVDYANNGKNGIALANSNRFDVVLLDLNLPDIDGIEVCRAIKSEGNREVPILMLTARDAFEDKAKGFGIGADDYLTKPFDFRELALRVEALARRPQLHKEKVLTAGRISLNENEKTCTVDNAPVVLTSIGFQILWLLTEVYPQAVSRADVIYNIWGDEAPDSNPLKSHIYSLRKALEPHFEATPIKTISTVGYKLEGISN